MFSSWSLLEAAICKGLNGCHVEAFVLLTPKSIGSWPHGAVTQQASISIVVSFDCSLKKYYIR